MVVLKAKIISFHIENNQRYEIYQSTEYTFLAPYTFQSSYTVIDEFVILN